MPELPEVETIRQGLVPHVVDRTITAVEVYHSRTVRMAPQGLTPLIGATINAVVRRGKYLWMLTDQDALVAHLGMSGQFRVDSTSAHIRARIHVAHGSKDIREPVGGTPSEPASELVFIDQRTFGHLQPDTLVPTNDGGPGGQGSAQASIPSKVAHIARDVLDPLCDLEVIANQVHKKHTEIKRALLNQNIASGIGNIYADEALWFAHVDPQCITSEMTIASITQVYQCAREVMKQALAVGGTSFDQLYVNVHGESGYFSRELQVYGRTGLPCKRCGHLIERRIFMNRSSHVCPACQPSSR